MKLLSVVLFGVVFDFVGGLRDRRWLQEQKVTALNGFDLLEGFGGMACTECFDKIDEARDCLRECNQDAYPGDSCCCCCECDKLANDLRPGSDGECDRDEDQCDATFGQNCKWELDKRNDGLHNKWYNLDEYCDCDKIKDIEKDNDRNCKNDDRRNDNDRSLLDFCLEDNSGDSIEDIDDLKECCDFKDKKCDEYFDEVKECLMGCINNCMIETAGQWLVCMRDNGDEGSCSRQECLDGYLDDLPEDLDLANEPDIFDLETVLKLVEKIETEDLEDCSLLDEFVTETCDVGNDCCDRCQEELGLTVDCLLNDIVIPFASGQLNTTITECPIDTERCRAEFRRELVERETDVESQEEATQCQRKMEANILAHNMSYAANQFMQCIMTAGFRALPDKPQGSAAGTLFSLFAAATFPTMVAIAALA